MRQPERYELVARLLGPINDRDQIIDQPVDAMTWPISIGVFAAPAVKRTSGLEPIRDQRLAQLVARLLGRHAQMSL